MAASLYFDSYIPNQANPSTSLSQDQPTTGSYKSHRLFRIVFVGLTLLTIIVLASVIPELTAIEVRKKLNNALELEQHLGLLLSYSQDAESSQRGYLLTSEARYLEPYVAARTQYDTLLRDIRDEITRDPVQLARVRRVRAALEQRFIELDSSIALHRQQDTTALAALIESDLGLRSMDSVRHYVMLLRDAEIRDIRIRQAQLAQLSTVTTILRFVGVIGLGLVFYYVYSQVKPLFETITESNDRLKLENAERRKAEKRNQELIESLNAKNRELDQFAYIASHDLREPLRTVSNYVEVLSEDYGNILDGEGKDLLSTIHRATDRMRSLIETLLQYSRIGRSEVPREVCLREPVDEALENLALRVEESGARVTIGELPVVEGFQVALRQLFQNLLANALKFHLPGHPPRIEVEGITKGRWVEIYVRDHGIGMNKSDQGKIFELFTQLETSDIKEGLGIGLAFCQKIVQLHYGTITVESEPGKGCTFTITLPSSLEDEEARVHYAN